MSTENVNINEEYENNMVRYFENKGNDAGAVASAYFLAGTVLKNNYQNIVIDLHEFGIGDRVENIEIIVRIKMSWYERIIKDIKNFILRPNILKRSYNGTQADYLAKK